MQKAMYTPSVRPKKFFPFLRKLVVNLSTNLLIYSNAGYNTKTIATIPIAVNLR